MDSCELKELHYNIIMKKILTIISILLATTLSSIAGEFTRITTSCGCKGYTQRIIIGYDHCRRPIYDYRQLPVKHVCVTHWNRSKPRYYYNRGYSSCRTTTRYYYSRPYYSYRYSYSYGHRGYRYNYHYRYGNRGCR